MGINLPMVFAGTTPELCAEGIAIGTDALFIGSDNVRPDELDMIAAQPRPKSDGLTTLVPLRADVLDWSRLQRYLDLYPPQSLDRTVFVLPPTVVGDQSLAGLGAIADRVGLPVRYPAGRLTGDGTAGLDLAGHRVLDLNAAGEQVAPGTGDWVQVAPLDSRAATAYRNDLLSAVGVGGPQLRQRLVPTPEGVQFGLPPAAVERILGAGPGERGPVPAQIDGDAAFTETGTTPAVADGYADLMYRLRDLPPGGQVLVEADRMFLVFRDPQTGGLATVDVAAMAPGLLPPAPATIRYAELPAGPALRDRLDDLHENLLGVRPGESAAVASQDGLELFRWQTATGSTATIEIIGPRTAIEPYLPELAAIAEQLDQPIIVAGVERRGGVLPSYVQPRLNERLEIYGWGREVPVVVTLADLGTAGDLVKTLDSRNAALLYQSPGLSTATPGDLFANLGMPPWGIREPGKAEPTAVRDGLSADLVQSGGGVGRLPRFAPPSRAVGEFLVTKLTEPQSVRDTIGRLGTDLRDGQGQIAEIKNRVPSFAGHQAVVDLAAGKHLDSTLGYLADRGTPGAMLKPLIGATPAEIPGMLPQLADLAGVGLGDVVSQRIAQSLSDLIAGTATESEVRDRIHGLSQQLPERSGVRMKWVEQLDALAGVVPEHAGVITHVMESIVTCP
ncbi:MAG TPA: hypothetical protein VN408_14550 [Actinoplanes sp.]|nr:hypothetical protein [Actinoplanes sp.]